MMGECVVERERREGRSGRWGVYLSSEIWWRNQDRAWPLSRPDAGDEPEPDYTRAMKGAA